MRHSRLRRSDWRRLALLWERLAQADPADAPHLTLEVLEGAMALSGAAVWLGPEGKLQRAAQLGLGTGEPGKTNGSRGYTLAEPLVCGRQRLGVLTLSPKSKAGPHQRAFVHKAAQALASKLSTGAPETAAATADESLQVVFDHLPSGVLVWDAELRLVTANAKAEALLRKDLRQAQGRPVKEVLKEREGFMEAVTAVTKSEKPISRRSMIINLEGEPRTIGYSGAPIPATRSFVLLFQDISAFVSV